MKKKPSRRTLFLIAVPLLTLTLCLLAVQLLKNLSPSAVPWLFGCGMCIVPVLVGALSFSGLLSFSKRVPHLDVSRHVDELGRKHTTLELSAVTRDEARALRREETEAD
jgi:hypothetical protein